MKLPEYDNRPPPGTPLYQSASDEWFDFKLVSGVIGLIAVFAALAYGLIVAVKTIL